MLSLPEPRTDIGLHRIRYGEDGIFRRSHGHPGAENRFFQIAGSAAAMLLKAPPFYENAKGDVMEIKFSIIIPVYNAEKHLSRCIESVLNSTLKEIEVICVNDASRDNSAVILERLRKKDSRVTVVTFEENRGVAAARNTGLDLAKGTIIGFVDSDDWIESFHLADIYAKMQKERSELNFISFKFVKPDKVIYYPDLTQYIEKFGSATQKMDCVEKITLLDDFCWRLAIRRSFWESSNNIIT